MLFKIKFKLEISIKGYKFAVVEIMTKEEVYIKRCISLAKKGLKSTAPNPMVGCVIVHNNKIIGEGYHIKYGEAHAEVNAIEQVKEKELLSKSTLYVSLEPCVHFGKTPPCCNLIIEKKIPKVVIACVDPFDEVSGKGIERLENAGIEVVLGVLEKEALELNKRFFTFHKNKRPYIILKWAQTLDGFIDLDRNNNSKREVNWITTPKTKQLTDTWRSEEDAILVGKNTILNDNPKLTVRTILGKNPIRLIIDKNLELPKTSNIFNSKAQTIVFNSKINNEINNIKYVKIDSKKILNDILKWLYLNNIQSVLVEGGAYTLQQFIDENKWDEARIYIGNKFFNKGINAPVVSKKNCTTYNYNNDKIIFIRNTK